jgi:hypothetical protein
MSSASNLIGGAFAHLTAPFAVHPNDRKRAVAYLEAAVAANVDWPDAENDIRDYLKLNGCNDATIRKEIDRARPLLEPWLT